MTKCQLSKIKKKKRITHRHFKNKLTQNAKRKAQNNMEVRKKHGINQISRKKYCRANRSKGIHEINKARKNLESAFG